MAKFVDGANKNALAENTKAIEAMQAKLSKFEAGYMKSQFPSTRPPEESAHFAKVSETNKELDAATKHAEKLRLAEQTLSHKLVDAEAARQAVLNLIEEKKQQRTPWRRSPTPSLDFPSSR